MDLFAELQLSPTSSRHIRWLQIGVLAWTLWTVCNKLVIQTQEKKMWFESSGTPQNGQMPVPGPFRLRTSTPDGSRPRIHCHMKTRIFRESAAWRELLDCVALPEPMVDDGPDQVRWRLEPSGLFST